LDIYILRTVKLMSKRKKIKKAGSTTRNIHKIATTLGVVPLVTMSSFLFHDSYALANVSQPNIIMDLASSSHMSVYLSDIFGADSLSYSFSGSVSDDVSDSILLTNSSTLSGRIDLYGYSPGTATVTVGVLHNGHNENPTFTVNIIDSALISDTLDSLHDGLDIGDIVYASAHQTPAADFNGDGVNNTDLTKLLGLIPSAYVNHRPTVSSIPNMTIVAGHSTTVTFSSYFNDEDSNLIYRLYNDDPTNESSAIFSCPSVTGEFVFSSSKEGSRTFSIVADDQHGGNRVAKFTVTATPNHQPAMAELVDGMVFTRDASFDLDNFFLDVDGDSLNYKIITPSTALSSNHFTSMYSYLNNTPVGSEEIDIEANDGFHTTPTTLDNLKATVLDSVYSYHVGETKELDFSNIFASGSTVTVFDPIDFGVTNEIATVSFVPSLDGGMGKLSVIGRVESTIYFTVEATKNNIVSRKLIVILIRPDTV
jgi:hypothetical protein